MKKRHMIIMRIKIELNSRWKKKKLVNKRICRRANKQMNRNERCRISISAGI